MKEELSNLRTYPEVAKYLSSQNPKRNLNLLLGNGFSMSFNRDIFSYNALSKFIEKLDDDTLHKLFDIVKTSNFELIMQQLETAAKIVAIFGGNKKQVEQINNASQELKKKLIEAVKELHPEHVFTIEDKESKHCASFLKFFIDNKGEIFTTNYDLLLYWVLMRNDDIELKTDGFGRDLENPDEHKLGAEGIWSELRWGRNAEEQNIHYLHGALHLFDDGIEIVKEEYANNEYLLTRIEERFDNKEYPIFVTAGDSFEKKSHIMHNKYLTYCYDKLTKISGTLVSFGFNFGRYDTHIIDAINKAALGYFDEDKVFHKLLSVYIGVYSDADLEHINSIKGQFRCKVGIFNAQTVNIWGK